MSALDWLLDPERSDPAIRWQVMCDLLGSQEAEWSAERAKVATEGWGASLLAHEDEDGQWAGGAYFPGDFDFDGPEAQPGAGQPWTATSHSLSQLRDFGLDPASDAAQRALRLIGANCRWEEAGQPFWDGEVEPCINGITVANGAYLGVDVSTIVDRLLAERLDDGGWNCEAVNGSVRSSYDTTINVLEGLLEYERATGGTPATQEARQSAEEFLLERQLFLRLSTGEPADEDFLLFRNPSRWQYDVLRALDYFRGVGKLTGTDPDPRLGAAVELVRAKGREDGTWLLDKSPNGRVWLDVDDGPGKPSRWVTLRALRVLDWVGGD
jgi:hypothetical protein